MDTARYLNTENGRVVQATRWDDGRYCYRIVKDGGAWGRVMVMAAAKFEARFAKIEEAK
jgi:hypothetical protein